VIEGDDLLARMIQHEIDHLDGLLVLDRVEPDVRREALKDMRTREFPAGERSLQNLAPRSRNDRGL
jgi:Polypeptide deformylase